MLAVERRRLHRSPLATRHQTFNTHYSTMSLASKLLSPGLLTLIFTTLSVVVGIADGRQCYWCGPLAEQVHRSRRAPPCAGAGHLITVCEPGYSYCAVVATSPPYMESRYCVKVYEDECYPQFCNTTKTWKMTCSCRGDLCNGNNGDRETDAFEVLPKLVNKTHSRIKKRAPNNKLRSKQNKMVNPKDENEFVDNSLGDQLSNEKSNTNSDNPPIIRSLKEITKNDTPNAENDPSSASSNLPAQPEQNAPTIPDTPTTMIEIQFKLSHPTDSIHKINDVVSHEIEISPEPAIQQDDQGLNTKDEKHATLYKNESDLGEVSQNSNKSSAVSATLETSGTLTTVLVSLTGDSSKTGNSAAEPEVPVENADESTTAHIASVPSILPWTTATDSNPLTTLVNDITATSLVDQAPPKIDAKSPIDKITKQAESPTAEAFLQDSTAVDKSDEEKTQTKAVTTHSPPPAETVHTTTDNPVTQSTTTLTTANVSESSNKQKKNKTKNAAVTIQASILAIICGIIIVSRILQ